MSYTPPTFNATFLHDNYVAPDLSGVVLCLVSPVEYAVTLSSHILTLPTVEIRSTPNYRAIPSTNSPLGSVKSLAGSSPNYRLVVATSILKARSSVRVRALSTIRVVVDTYDEPPNPRLVANPVNYGSIYPEDLPRLSCKWADANLSTLPNFALEAWDDSTDTMLPITARGAWLNNDLAYVSCHANRADLTFAWRNNKIETSNLLLRNCNLFGAWSHNSYTEFANPVSDYGLAVNGGVFQPTDLSFAWEFNQLTVFGPLYFLEYTDYSMPSISVRGAWQNNQLHAIGQIYRPDWYGTGLNAYMEFQCDIDIWNARSAWRSNQFVSFPFNEYFLFDTYDWGTPLTEAQLNALEVFFGNNLSEISFAWANNPLVNFPKIRLSKTTQIFADYAWDACILNDLSVQRILVSLDESGSSNINTVIGKDESPLTAIATAAYNSLLSKNCNIRFGHFRECLYEQDNPGTNINTGEDSGSFSCLGANFTVSCADGFTLTDTSDAYPGVDGADGEDGGGSGGGGVSAVFYLFNESSRAAVANFYFEALNSLLVQRPQPFSVKGFSTIRDEESAVLDDPSSTTKLFEVTFTEDSNVINAASSLSFSPSFSATLRLIRIADASDVTLLWHEMNDEVLVDSIYYLKASLLPINVKQLN